MPEQIDIRYDNNKNPNLSWRERLTNLYEGTTYMYRNDPAHQLDTEHARSFMKALEQAGRRPPANENQFVFDCMEAKAGVKKALIMISGIAAIPLSRVAFRHNTLAKVTVPVLTAAATFIAVGTDQLATCRACLIEHSDTAISRDYRRRLGKQQPNHPLIQYHQQLKLQQEQNEQQLKQQQAQQERLIKEREAKYQAEMRSSSTNNSVATGR